MACGRNPNANPSTTAGFTITVVTLKTGLMHPGFTEHLKSQSPRSGEICPDDKELPFWLYCLYPFWSARWFGTTIISRVCFSSLKTDVTETMRTSSKPSSPQVILRFLHWAEHRADALASVWEDSDTDNRSCCWILRGGFFRAFKGLDLASQQMRET